MTDKQRIKILKESLASSEGWGERWRDHANDLEAKLSEALTRLEMIASDFHYKSECENIADSATRLKRTASFGLKKISRMRERKP